MVRIILTSRSIHLFLGLLTGLAALSFALGGNALVIELTSIHPKNRLPYPELCAVLGGVLGAMVLRPRFWEWDRLGARRVAVLSGLCAAVGMSAPLLLVVIGASRLDAGVPWSWAAANALVFCALAFGLAPFIGVGPAGGATIVLYFAVGVLNHLVPAAHNVLPVVAYPGPSGRWWVAGTLALAAVGAHIYTRGATGWAHRVFSRD
jgi:hypothetical protein